jgi:hypothetical protein
VKVSKTGTWLAWGIGIPADLFDGYAGSVVSIYDEELIAAIRERDPEWPPPNDDVEDLDELNDSWAIEVSGITEQEVQEQVSVYPDEVRGVIRIRYDHSTLGSVGSVSAPAERGRRRKTSITDDQFTPMSGRQPRTHGLITITRAGDLHHLRGHLGDPAHAHRKGRHRAGRSVA